MWTLTTRREHSRDHLRYGSDPTDAEREIIAPFLPPPRRTGRPRRWPMGEVVNAIFYVLRAGCPWRMLPDSVAQRDRASLGRSRADDPDAAGRLML